MSRLIFCYGFVRFLTAIWEIFAMPFRKTQGRKNHNEQYKILFVTNTLAFKNEFVWSSFTHMNYC